MNITIFTIASLQCFELANPADFDISKQKFHQKINSLVEQLSLHSKGISHHALAQFFAAGNLMTIAVHDRRDIVGMACLACVTKVNGKTGRIEHVIVDNGYRGKGLSSRLVEPLIRIAKEDDLRHLDLAVSTDDAEINAMYKNLGFVRRKTNPYRLEL